MKTIQVGEFKTHFSDIMSRVRGGEEVIITYGRKKENIAAVIPYKTYKKRNRIKLGALRGKKYCIKDDFAMTPEDLLGL